MDVSIIIVSYNTSRLLRDCILSIKRYTSGVQYEIIVVDNNSYDGSAAMVEKDFPEIMLVRNRENVGFGKANNKGYKASKGRYVLFLNPDTLLISNAIQEFFNFMERKENSDVFACGGKLVQKDLTPTTSYGNFPSHLEIILTALRIDRLLPAYMMDKISSGVIPKASATIDVDYIVGADIFMRKSAVYGESPFDEDFFLYFEETELCCRLKRAGYRAVIIPRINIIHFEGQSSAEKTYQYYALSQLTYLKKCRGKWSAAFIKRFIMTLFVIRYLMTFNRKYIRKYALYREMAF